MIGKFENKTWVCSSCKKEIVFIILKEVECDWGIHTLIQCPSCADLFSIDNPCQAFSDLTTLVESNLGVVNGKELLEYQSGCHDCL